MCELCHPVALHSGFCTKKLQIVLCSVCGAENLQYKNISSLQAINANKCIYWTSMKFFHLESVLNHSAKKKKKKCIKDQENFLFSLAYSNSIDYALCSLLTVFWVPAAPCNCEADSALRWPVPPAVFKQRESKKQTFTAEFTPFLFSRQRPMDGNLRQRLVEGSSLCWI